MRAARLALLLLLVLAAPVSAQGVDVNDPCYKALTALSPKLGWASTDPQTLASMLPRLNAVWGDRVRLNQYITTLSTVVRRFPNVAMASDDPNLFSEGWEPTSMWTVYKCMPWLEALLSRMDDRLQELGGVSGTIVSPRPGGRKDPRIEEMLKRVQEFARVLEQMLNRSGRR